MEKRNTLLIVITLGLISIIFGSYLAISGGSFSNYFYSILMGVVLTGTAWIQLSQKKQQAGK